MLAPLLFILYINDVKSCLNHAMIKLFADGTLLMITNRNLEKMQEDIDNIWFCENKLKLNISKTKFMVLSKNHVNRDECVIKLKMTLLIEQI